MKKLRMRARGRRLTARERQELLRHVRPFFPELERSFSGKRAGAAPAVHPPLSAQSGAKTATTDAIIDAADPRPVGKEADGPPTGLHALRQAISRSLPTDSGPWPCPVFGELLLGEIVNRFKMHVVLPEGGAEAVALWTVHTYAIDATNLSPILAFLSPAMRSGKSTALELLGALVFRPLMASNVTAAALFRRIESDAPTVLIDEADTFLTKNEELRGVLNGGYRRGGGQVLRSPRAGVPSSFNTFCPKAIAGIGRLPGTIMDRSIILNMQRRARSEYVVPIRLDRLLADLLNCRRRALRWGRDHLEALQECDPVVPDGLHDRAADNWRPLLAIAQCVGGDWPERARRAALAIAAAAEDDTDLGVLVLADIRTIFDETGARWLASQDITARLAAMEERPWPDLSHGRPITPPRLARLLKPFAIVPGQSWETGKNNRGYARAAFEEAFQRYLPIK